MSEVNPDSFREDLESFYLLVEQVFGRTFADIFFFFKLVHKPHYQISAPHSQTPQDMNRRHKSSSFRGGQTIQSPGTCFSSTASPPLVLSSVYQPPLGPRSSNIITFSVAGEECSRGAGRGRLECLRAAALKTSSSTQSFLNIFVNSLYLIISSLLVLGTVSEPRIVMVCEVQLDGFQRMGCARLEWFLDRILVILHLFLLRSSNNKRDTMYARCREPLGWGIVNLVYVVLFRLLCS